MINVRKEELIRVSDVPFALPLRRSGKRVHVSTCYRWICSGLRGMRLESIQIGGTTYTSQEALQRFGERLTAKRVPVEAAGARMSKSRETQIALASAKLRELLRRGSKPI